MYDAFFQVTVSYYASRWWKETSFSCFLLVLFCCGCTSPLACKITVSLLLGKRCLCWKCVYCFVLLQLKAFQSTYFACSDLHTGCWWSPLFQISHQSNINKINSTSKEESCLVGTSVQTNHIFISQFCGPFTEPSNVLILQLPGHIYIYIRPKGSATVQWTKIYHRFLDSIKNQCTNPQQTPGFQYKSMHKSTVDSQILLYTSMNIYRVDSCIPPHSNAQINSRPLDSTALHWPQSKQIQVSTAL